MYGALEKLIQNSVPAHFASLSPYTFFPHVTLTSEIPEKIDNPQAWLDALELPFADEVKVRFQYLDVEKPFFRKCNIAVEKDGVSELALECRSKGVENDRRKAAEWIEQQYRPHCSLL